jgi:hypothetical protein
MFIQFLLQIGSGYTRPHDSMEGVPSFVGWIILVFFLYIIFRVWLEIEKGKKGKT